MVDVSTLNDAGINFLRFSLADLVDKASVDALQAIVDCLEELDGEDTFGTEGWKHLSGYED